MIRVIGIEVREVIKFHSPVRSILLQASNTNKGTIYIDFEHTVAAGDCAWELQAGDWIILDDYHGPIYAIADTADQILNGGFYQRFDDTKKVS